MRLFFPVGGSTYKYILSPILSFQQRNYFTQNIFHSLQKRQEELKQKFYFIRRDIEQKELF